MTNTNTSTSKALGWVLTRLVVPGAITGAGVVCAGLLLASRGSAERDAPPPIIPMVDVAVAAAMDGPALLHTAGAVTPAQQVTLTPQVSGKIVWQSDDLVPGGRFAKGEVLAKIDARDYDLALRAEESRVQQAQVELALEANRAKVAEQEWTLLGDGRERSQAALALREPQLELARQNAASAEASLERAKLNLSRTRLVAPFNAIVVAENADIGQVVGASSQVATLVGTDHLWVQIDVPVDKLPSLQLPDKSGNNGSPARVQQSLGDQEPIVRDGRLARVMGQLNPQTRTAQLLIEIEQPFEGEGLPILPGAWVDVTLQGPPVPGAVEIPRVAVGEGDQVWVVSNEGTLEKREIEVAWRAAETLVVREGIQAGERVVTTPLNLPVEGMQVRVRGQEG